MFVLAGIKRSLKNTGTAVQNNNSYDADPQEGTTLFRSHTAYKINAASKHNVNIFNKKLFRI
jgi:hypothetical protein